MDTTGDDHSAGGDDHPAGGEDHPAGGEDPSGVVPPNPQSEEEYDERRRRQQQHHKNTFQDHTGDGTTPGRIFVGGLAWTMTEAQFEEHFSKYGDITNSEIMEDWKNLSRGFGFITYADPSVVDKVIEDNHVINGKQVEIRRARPRKLNPPPPSSSESYNNNSRSSYGGYSGSLGVGGYRSDSMYGGRSGPYGGYGSDFGGSGAYAAMEPNRYPSLAYGGPNGGGFGRGYELGSRYGGTRESYRAYGGSGGGGGGAGANDFSLGSGYGGASGGRFYGSRGYGAGRYHPYGR